MVQSWRNDDSLADINGFKIVNTVYRHSMSYTLTHLSDDDQFVVILADHTEVSAQHLR